MSNNTLHKLGIDIGSTTVKVAVLDENDNLLFSDYERHFANIRETLSLLVEKAYKQLGDMQIAPMIDRFRWSYPCKTFRRAVCPGGHLRIHCFTALCTTD